MEYSKSYTPLGVLLFSAVIDAFTMIGSKEGFGEQAGGQEEGSGLVVS